MRIGVDATCWQNRRGYGRHSRALLSALVNLDVNNQYVLFMDSDKDIEDLPIGAELNLVKTDAPTAQAASAKGRRSARDMWRMARAMSSTDLDLLFFPTIYSYVPVMTRAKKIVMIHDVIAEKYLDLTMPKFSARLFWKTKVALGRWQADAVATVSDFSRRGIVEHFGMDADRVHVVREANDPVFRVLKDPQPTQHLTSLGFDPANRSIVYVGGFSPHKNLEMLVRVFSDIIKKPGFSDLQLILVGDDKTEVFYSYVDTIKNMVADLGLGKRVLFTGFLSDEELVILFNLSTVSVLPSLIEGFGLPAVEAAACGCAVIATRESPLPSVLGEGALHFDPRNKEELERALLSVLESPSLRERIRMAGVDATSKLTWEAAAKEMVNLINSVTTS